MESKGEEVKMKKRKMWEFLLVLLVVVAFDVSGLDSVIHGFICPLINLSPAPCVEVYDMPFWEVVIAVLLFYIVRLLFQFTKECCHDKD